MDIAKQVKCTTCQEIPVKEIFQCRNMHIICTSCLTTTRSCSKCSVSLIGDDNRFRNATFESVLDALEFPCENKELGCGQMLKRGEMKEHSQKNCKYSGLVTQLCKGIGYKSCNFRCNTGNIDSILEHFEQNHNATIIQSSSATIQYKNFDKIFDELNSFRYIGPPVILKRVGHEITTSFLILPICSGTSGQLNKTCSWICIFLGDLPADGKQFQAEFSITNVCTKASILKWTTLISCVDTAAPFLENPPFLIKWTLLCKHYCKNSDLSLEIRIQQIASGPIKAKPAHAPSKPNCVRLEMSSGENSEQQESTSETQGTVFEGVGCDGCDRFPIAVTRHKCLQCEDYDLCEECGGSGLHSHHIFAIITNAQQNELINRLQILRSLDGNHTFL